MRPDDEAQLRRAERLIAGLRLFGLCAIGATLAYGPHEVAPTAWALYAASFVYGAVVVVAFGRGVPVRTIAIATTIGDLAVIIPLSAVSGGLLSDVFLYAYAAILAGAIRYGARETFLSVALYGACSIGLYFVPDSTATPYDLGIRLFFIVFISLLASQLSGEVKRRSQELVAERDKSQTLLRRLMSAEEEERKRLAGEIHDRLGRRFFEFYHGIGRSAEALRERDRSASEALDKLAGDARACADEIRNLANELRPSILDDFGFVEALRESAVTLEDQGELDVRLHVGVTRKLPRPEVNVMLFRVLQEAILNVRKHAQARSIAIDLCDADGGGVRLSVRDDGRGFDPAAPAHGHLGLLTMRERAEACGARLSVRSRPGQGSEVEVVVPES